MTEASIDLPPLAFQIAVIRGRPVLMDAVLAELYGATTKALLQALRGNADRFQADFVSQAEKHEVGTLRSQFVISNDAVGRGARAKAERGPHNANGVKMSDTILPTHQAMELRIESECEDDGRWLAEVPQLPGCLAYGATRDEALSRRRPPAFSSSGD